MFDDSPEKTLSISTAAARKLGKGFSLIAESGRLCKSIRYDATR